MKILKPGKVEMRKYTCPKCGCVFAAYDCESFYGYVDCPQKGCYEQIEADRGEIYDEDAQGDELHSKAEDRAERLAELIYDGCVTDGETAWEIAEHLICNGVTLRDEKM